MRKVLVALSFLACSACNTKVNPEAKKGPDKGRVFATWQASAELFEFSLSDGTKCAGFIGMDKAAITCGWRIAY